MKLAPHKKIQSAQRGFALVITVSLMVLLTLLALAMLTLSQISLRNSNSESARGEAEANARLALALAIGELQRTAGLDTRVTAKADILDPNNPPVLGVWKSWEGTDHDSTGRPISPAYTSKQPKGGNSRFLTWLASPNFGLAPENQTVPTTAKATGSVTLLGDGSLGTDPANQKYEISLAPTIINQTASKKGAIAWWVCGENQKARLPQPYTATSNSDWAANLKSHAVADPKPFGIKDSLLTDPLPAAKAISLQQTDFIDQTGSPKASRAHFFDLSAVSTGLLTNTATGGWRKDLSLFTENYNNTGSNAIPTSKLQLFRLMPAQDSSQGRAIASQPGSALAAGSMLYPWSGYRSGGSMPYEQAGAVASWANLADYALMYRKFGNASSFSLTSSPFTSLGDTFKYLHTVKPMPIVARLQWVYAYAMTQAPNNQQRVTVKLTPVVTLWNPYNVILNVGPLVFTVSRLSTMPVALEYEVDYSDGVTVKSGGDIGGYKSLTGHGSYSPNVSSGSPQFYINSVGAMPPGGTKVFSITANNPNTLISYSLEAGEGFSPNNGHFIQISDPSGTQIYSPRAKGGADRATRVRTKVKLDNAIAGTTLAGKFGLRLVVREDGGGQGTGRIDGQDGNEMIYQMLMPPASASAAEIALPVINVSNITTNGYPFMSLAFGLRAIDNLNVPGDSHDKNRLAKGFVQTSPTATFSDMTIYPAGSNRVNAAYDFNLIVHSANDDTVPNASGNKGFILTGLTAGTGLTRFIAADLPVKPLASLAELQGWDMRFGNPAQPFAYNVIGNSDATPLIPSNAAYLANTPATNLQHDDSYCANHVLFDDWFFSSIAGSRPDQFGGSASQLKTCYTDFLSGTRPLANRAYKAIAGDQAIASQGSSNAAKLFDDNVNQPDSWRKMASHLEVEGMFNVNSTSVTAWQALLGHARGQQVPHYGANGNITLDPKTDYPVARYGVAGDIRADSDSQGVSGDGRPNATQYTGYRVFTDQMIQDLAAKIVDQVRKRGPFLSLSEFVNRQLSNDSGLAMAGAIQTALTQMESTVNGGIDAARANGDATASGYQFPNAAVGSSAYGMPGWARQADILRPLAPILSVRDDTFLVRAYGDARDAGGKITARATCEAVVRRTRDYVDPGDLADLADPPKSNANKTFGRRFVIVSFRWLNPDEI